MNKRNKKYVLDMVMSIFFVICMGYQLTGNLWHEIIGVAMFVLFILHNILNGYWFVNYKKIFSNLKNPAMKISFIIDNLVIIDMVVLAVTSVLISRSVFAFIGINGGYILCKLHIASAYLGFILLSIHLGCHWKQILTHIYKGLKINRDSKVVKVINLIIAVMIIVAGVVSSFNRGIGSKILFNNNSRKNIPMNKDINSYSPNDSEIKSDGDSNEVNNSGSFNGTADSISLSYVNGGRGGHGGHGGNGGHGGEGNSSSVNDFPDVSDGESLQDYLGKITCTGCGRQCLLTAPQCGRGQAQAEVATEKYNSGTSTQDESSKSETSAQDESNKSETSTQDESNKSETNDSNETIDNNGKNETNKEDESSVNNDSNTSDSESLEEYLGKLVCTGCGKQCPLTSPQCNTGVQQAEKAKENYNSESSTENESNNSNVNNNNNQNNSDNSSGDGERKYKNHIALSGDDDFVDLFTGMLPIGGMYVAGTYYTLEILKKKKSKKIKEDSKDNNN